MRLVELVPLVRVFKDRYRITANDIQYYSYIMAQAKLNTPRFTFKKLGLDHLLDF